MAIRTQEELISSMQNIIGERTDDDALNFITDVRDTMASLSGGGGNVEAQIQAAVDAKDAEWRQRYKDTFFSGGGGGAPSGGEHDDPPADKKLTYESLFKEDK